MTDSTPPIQRRRMRAVVVLAAVLAPFVASALCRSRQDEPIVALPIHEDDAHRACSERSAGPMPVLHEAGAFDGWTSFARAVNGVFVTGHASIERLDASQHFPMPIRGLRSQEGFGLSVFGTYPDDLWMAVHGTDAKGRHGFVSGRWNGAAFVVTDHVFEDEKGHEAITKLIGAKNNPYPPTAMSCRPTEPPARFRAGRARLFDGRGRCTPEVVLLADGTAGSVMPTTFPVGDEWRVRGFAIDGDSLLVAFSDEQAQSRAFERHADGTWTDYPLPEGTGEVDLLHGEPGRDTWLLVRADEHEGGSTREKRLFRTNRAPDFLPCGLIDLGSEPQRTA